MATLHQPITADWTVNAVVGVYPTSLPVFGRYGIDSCCGGLKTLREVAEAHHLTLDRLLADLVAVTTPSEPRTRPGR
jgi:iron-sulfur cluster repair protein YtfE (RIC family)